MTLSNFDWTDKKTVRWFIILPSEHEGPYSLDAFVAQGITRTIRVWAEGLPAPVTLQVALDQANPQAPVEAAEDSGLPPPLPFQFSEPEQKNAPAVPVFTTPAIPVAVVDEAPQEISVPHPKRAQQKKILKISAGAMVACLLAFVGLKTWVGSQGEFSINRRPKMSPELFKKINADFRFEGWKKKIFFKEYVSSDLSHIWLISSSYQTCDVEATFNSFEDKLLTPNYEKISFHSRGILKDHIAEFSQFKFTSGVKIIPGLYEVDIKAKDCAWDGLLPNLANDFSGVEGSYASRMKVVLYSKGALEFNHILDKIIKKKLEISEKEKSVEDMFWQDLQQKLQTLVAITLQVEQLFNDLLENDPKAFQQKLKPSVDQYTKQFGHFLTKFVIANENYFKDLEKTKTTHIEKKRTYESMIKLSSKDIALESMKLIEELQAMKAPTKDGLKKTHEKAQKSFERLKVNMNQKIIKVTDDQSKV